jgi:hypothetical protein
LSPRQASPARLTGHSMPDLSDLYKTSILNVMLDSLAGGDRGPANYPERGCWINLVRLTDKSLIEYESARSHLDDWIERKNAGVFSALFRAIDHFENAVVSIHRAIRMSDALRNTGIGKPGPTPTSRQREQLRILRNHIEHADEKLIERKIQKGDPFFLTPSRTRIQLGPASEPFRATCGSP